MRRREFVTLLGGAAAAWPLAVQAQQPRKMRRIGFVSGTTLIPSLFGGFLDGMRDLGYAEGKDFVMEWRFAEGNYDRFPDIAADLVSRKVDVIVLTLPAAVRPMQQATNSIPIVMGYSNDPVGSGFVSSLSKPGANVTGLAGSADVSAPKQLEWLAATVPNLSRIGVLANPSNTIGAAPVPAQKPIQFGNLFADEDRSYRTLAAAATPAACMGFGRHCV